MPPCHAQKQPEVKHPLMNAKRLQAFLRIHIRRIGVMAFSIVCGNYLFLTLIGLFNRLHPKRPIRTLFLTYPANMAYLTSMVYAWYAPPFRWRPGLSQVLAHGHHWGLSFAVSSGEAHYNLPENRALLAKLHQRMERIKRIVGAHQVTYSGILPGLFVRQGLIPVEQCHEIHNTAKVVSRAVSELTRLAGMPEKCPVIILGGKGTIGSRVVDLLQRASDRPVCAIDVDNQTQFPSHFRGQAVVVLNITKLGALSQYIPQLWPEAVVLNEVYPEPRRAELGRIRCWHIAGVQGWALPAFRGAYADALPCCAAYLLGDQFSVVLRQIN